MKRTLNCAVLIRIGEENSVDTVDKNLYDQNGNVSGEKTQEQLDTEIQELQGKRVLFVEAQCDGKTARYQSPHVESDDTHITNALATVLVTVSASLVKQFRKQKREQSRIIQINGN